MITGEATARMPFCGAPYGTEGRYDGIVTLHVLQAGNAVLRASDCARHVLNVIFGEGDTYVVL